MPTIDIDKNFAKKLSVTISLILSIYGNLKYCIGRLPNVEAVIFKGDPEDRVGFSPFTANLLLLIIYWGFTHFLQILYVSRILKEEERSNNGSADGTREDESWLGFTGFNLLQFLWVWLFSNGHYILSEIVVIFNFIHILVLYFVLKSYKFSVSSLTDYIINHGAVIAFPLAWLLYCVFWNGAVLIGSTSLAFRIVCNVFIWQFLIIPVFFLIIFRDWEFGLTSAFITLALGLGQLFTKVFALQWIFALVISAILALSSIAVWSGNLGRSETAISRESEPLIR